MKLRIEQPFVDKFTGEDYKVGSEVEFEKDRAAELLADTRKLVSAVEEETVEPKKPAEEKPKKAATKKAATKKK